MKKTLSFALILAFCLMLFACGGRTIDDSASPNTAVTMALNALGMNDRGTVYLSETDNEFEKLTDSDLEGFFENGSEAPKASWLVSYSFFKAFDKYGTEIGVFKMANGDMASKMEELIKARYQMLKKTAPTETEQKQVSSFTVKVDGVWVYYIVNENTVDAIKEIEKILYQG